MPAAPAAISTPRATLIAPPAPRATWSAAPRAWPARSAAPGYPWSRSRTDAVHLERDQRQRIVDEVRLQQGARVGADAAGCGPSKSRPEAPTSAARSRNRTPRHSADVDQPSTQAIGSTTRVCGIPRRSASDSGRCAPAPETRRATSRPRSPSSITPADLAVLFTGRCCGPSPTCRAPNRSSGRERRDALARGTDHGRRRADADDAQHRAAADRLGRPPRAVEQALQDDR